MRIFCGGRVVVRLSFVLLSCFSGLLWSPNVQAQSASASELHSTVRTEEDGTEWTSVHLNPAGRPAWLVGLGYEVAPGSAGRLDPNRKRAFSHVQLQFGGGWALWGRFGASASPGHRTRLRADVVYAQMFSQLGIPVGDPEIASYLILGGRLQYLHSRNHHALMMSVSAGGRWDLVESQIGAEVALGLGYAFLLPKVPLPLWLEGVWETGGALDGHRFGMRLMIAWALGN